VLVGSARRGKSTVGAAVAGRLGVAFRDTDADVEALRARPSPTCSSTTARRVPRARARRRRPRAAEHDGVLSLGGGAVLDAGTRQLLPTTTSCCSTPTSARRRRASGWGRGVRSSA
jgi:shikimate kinase